MQHSGFSLAFGKKKKTLAPIVLYQLLLTKQNAASWVLKTTGIYSPSCLKARDEKKIKCESSWFPSKAEGKDSNLLPFRDSQTSLEG